MKVLLFICFSLFISGFHLTALSQAHLGYYNYIGMTSQNIIKNCEQSTNFSRVQRDSINNQDAVTAKQDDCWRIYVIGDDSICHEYFVTCNIQKHKKIVAELELKFAPTNDSWMVWVEQGKNHRYFFQVGKNEKNNIVRVYVYKGWIRPNLQHVSPY